jgi:hypothetical protein
MATSVRVLVVGGGLASLEPVRPRNTPARPPIPLLFSTGEASSPGEVGIDVGFEGASAPAPVSLRDIVSFCFLASKHMAPLKLEGWAEPVMDC